MYSVLNAERDLTKRVFAFVVVLAIITDRTTTIGKMINSYLAEDADMDDHAIHLLFSANRWEAV